MSSIDEQQLIKSVLNGNTSHAELLYKAHKDKVLGLIMKYIHDKEIAENLTQETFVKAFRNLKRFRQQCSFKSWIARIAVNLCKDYLSSQKNRHWESRVTIDDPEDTSALNILSRQKSINPEQEVLNQERNMHLRAAIDRLPPKQRECLLLNMEGYSYDEISFITGTPSKTVGTRLFNARKKIRSLLAGYYEEKQS